MKDSKELAQALVDFLYDSPTMFQVVENTKEILDKEGFLQLIGCEKWKLKKGSKYYITRNNSALIAFVVGEENPQEAGFKIIGAHTDSPAFKIKPSPEVISEGSYVKLNTEVYGGPILNTWLDRPLSVAGRITLRSDNPLVPKDVFINIKRPILVIPNLAIHMNRTVNDGVKLNKQTDVLPIISLINEGFEKDNYLLKIIAKEAKVELEDILDFDLYTYEFDKGMIMGENEEFISSSRIDDVSMVYGGIKALCAANKVAATNVMVCFDNEEVGSSTKQGADSQLLATILERIVLAVGGDREDYFRALSKSFIISADGAHAVHPNMSQKADPVNRPQINKGPAIKYSANQKYTSDSNSASVFKMLCDKAKVPYQTFVNRSDEQGGSTIGPISSTHLDIASVDFGVPMLAMHSVRELAGVMDFYYTVKVFEEFYNL